MIKKRWFLNILVANKRDKGSKCFLLLITIIDDRTFFLLRPAIQPHVLVHLSHKMIGSCVNILARTRNNPKEPLIAVIQFRIFFFTVETLNCHSTFFKSKRSVGLLLITVKRGISEFSHVRCSKAISTVSDVGGGRSAPITNFPSRHHCQRKSLAINSSIRRHIAENISMFLARTTRRHLYSSKVVGNKSYI